MCNPHFKSLYIHIPFCKNKCPYCAFVSWKDQSNRSDEYVDLLQMEFLNRRIKFTNGGPATIYIGGGTPLCLPADSLSKLLKFINTEIADDKTVEFSIESIPSEVTFEKALMLKEMGVNRVTLGMQSFSKEVLRFIKREDELDYFVRAIELLTKAGINNIGVDLIIGLPYETLKSFKKGIEYLLTMDIKHISAYILKVEKGTLFNKWVDEKKFKDQPNYLNRSMYHILNRAVSKAGFEQYEVSNYSKRSFNSFHNSLTWDYNSYAGLGISAVSFDGDQRINNPVDYKHYKNNVINKKNIIGEIEVLSDRDKINENIMLGLRTNKGLDTVKLRDLYNFDLLVNKKNEINNFIGKKWLKYSGKDSLRCTKSGILWLDTILCDLFI